ncbi:MAG: ribosome silencing factor [Actinobacteria bacterium]|nr:MAG: ribosome silencing factor [Actinomycetota bacterium]
MEASEAARIAARAAAEKQAQDVVVLEMRELIYLTDFFVIGTGRSSRQVRTIADNVEEKLEAAGLRCRGREGRQEGNWVLLDYGDVVVHVFTPEEREFYRLENIWKDAPRLEWEEEAAAR